MLRRCVVVCACGVFLISTLSGCNSYSSSSSLTGIDVKPAGPSISVGATQQFKATGHYSNGPDQDLTANSNWSSSVTSVATIQNVGTTPGLASGVKAGQTMITASFAQGSSNVTGSTNLTVVNTVVPSRLSEGNGMVVLTGAAMAMVDGRPLRISGATAMKLAAGEHVVRLQNGRQSYSFLLKDEETVNLEVSEGDLVRR